MPYTISDTNCSLIPSELYFINWKNYYQDFHQHENECLEIDYIVDGSCIYHINDRQVCLNRHSLLFHNGALPHDYMVRDSCLNMSILCRPQKIIPSYGALGDMFCAFPDMCHFFEHLDRGVVIKHASNFYPLLKEINACFFQNSNTMHLSLLITKLLIDALDASSRQHPARIYTEQIKDYIDYHFFSIQNLDEIANELSLNKVYMQRIFKQETGTTIWNYLNSVRIEKATYYLTMSNIPIGTIDELVGIHSRQNFYLLFRQKYHMSPAEYRKMHLDASRDSYV